MRVTTGRHFKRARKLLGYSIFDLADALGLQGPNAITHLREIERGRREPRSDLCHALAQLLEMEDETR